MDSFIGIIYGCFLVVLDCRYEEDEDDIYVTIDEAVAYVSQELDMTVERANQFVKTIDSNQDGMISSVELVLLNDRIKLV